MTEKQNLFKKVIRVIKKFFPQNTALDLINKHLSVAFESLCRKKFFLLYLEAAMKRETHLVIILVLFNVLGYKNDIRCQQHF